MTGFTRLKVVDSHTGGEPTRLVIEGGPPLGNGSISDRLEVFRQHYDRFRSAVVEEPRGFEAIVGALLCEPNDLSCAAGVIFFNNVGYLGMCGHGTIGLAATLAFLGKIGLGSHRIETPVGIVEVDLHSPSEVTVSNVASYRLHAGLKLKLGETETVTGDVAWGGNWFFITQDCPISLLLANLKDLTHYAWRIRHALARVGITGKGGAEIDHIEVCGPATTVGADSKNFVLCPGGSYDRSPCGTGTSAKLACLHAEGLLQEGQLWRQESLIGSIFEGSVRVEDGLVYPRIKGSAYITAESSLLLQENDPFCWGVPSA